MKRGQDCTKSFEKQMITQLIEQEERVKNIPEFLKKKVDMYADMFKGMLLKVYMTRKFLLAYSKELSK